MPTTDDEPRPPPLPAPVSLGLLLALVAGSLVLALRLEPRKAEARAPRRGAEMAIIYVPITRSGWQRITVDLADFAAVNFSRALSSRQGMENLLFTFDDNADYAGVAYLDNVAFEP